MPIMTQIEATTVRRSAVTHQRRFGSDGRFLRGFLVPSDLSLRARDVLSGCLTMRYLGRSRDSTEPSIERYEPKMCGPAPTPGGVVIKII